MHYMKAMATQLQALHIDILADNLADGELEYAKECARVVKSCHVILHPSEYNARTRHDQVEKAVKHLTKVVSESACMVKDELMD